MAVAREWVVDQVDDVAVVFEHFFASNFSTNGEWFRQRKILTPSFHFGILKRFVPVFNEHSKKFCEYVRKTNGQLIDVRQPLTLSTLDMLSGL